MEDSCFSIWNHSSLAWQSHRVILSLEKPCFLGLSELEAAKTTVVCALLVLLLLKWDQKRDHGY